MISESGERRAALLLHNLGRSDQDWMLAKMEPPQRSVLRHLLAELNALGIPRDEVVLGSVSAPTPDVESNRALSSLYEQRSMNSAVANKPQFSLSSVSAETMIAVLKDEPVELVARLLACSKWSWTDALMDSMEPLKRRQVQGSLHSVQSYAPRLSEAIVAALARKVVELDRAVPRPVKADANLSVGTFTNRPLIERCRMLWSRLK